jgi:hypothetical protein
MAPPERDEELAELGMLDAEVGAGEDMDWDVPATGEDDDPEIAFEERDVVGTDVVADVDDVNAMFTPNLAAIVIGIVSQHAVERPQHQVVEFAVPSQDVSSMLPPLT